MGDIQNNRHNSWKSAENKPTSQAMAQYMALSAACNKGFLPVPFGFSKKGPAKPAHIATRPVAK